MINKEKLNTLYNMILDEKELTTKELNNNGFCSNDLINLVKDGILLRVKKGLYKLGNVDLLFQYGKTLLSNMDYEKAFLCFLKCFMLDPTHLDSLSYLFLKSIKDKNYEEAFQFLESLLKVDDKFYIADFNYYLYLLSMITELPENLKECARLLKYEDIEISIHDKRYNDTNLFNEIRLYSMKKRFSYALSLLKKLINNLHYIKVEDIIMKTLLSQAAYVEINNKKILLKLIREKNYEAVSNFLFDEQARRSLSILEKKILQLSLQYLYIQEHSIIPNINIDETRDLYEAIDANNFVLALKINSEYMQKNNSSSRNNFMNYILTDICSLIDRLNLLNANDGDITFNEEDKPIIIKLEITLNTILSYLMNKDIDNAIDILKSYLCSLDKSEYEFLIVDLIKISLLENDNAFEKPMDVLTLISNGIYKFDISEFVMGFYRSLSQNKFEESRLYLDIISNVDKLGQESIITNGLLQVLETTERALACKKKEPVVGNSNLLEDVLFFDEDDSEPVLSDNKDVLESPNSEKLVELDNKPDEHIMTKEEFIDSKCKELISNKGIILLREVPVEEIENILNIISTYKDIKAFVINEDEKKHIVLRYHSYVKEFIDVKNILNLSYQAYIDNEYDKVLEYNLFLLQIFKEPRFFVYLYIGKAYAKKGNIDLAVDYLTVANELAKEENLDLNLTSFILNLIKVSDPMHKIVMEIKDFHDTDDYFGIDNFYEINDFIIVSRLDVESACKQLNMSYEQISIIKLIYAREYYLRGDFLNGDLFLNSVKRSNNKTATVRKILEEIIKTRKFYPNREIEYYRSLLVLSLNPGNGN